MKEEQNTTRPAFSAPLYAALRQGAKELAQALPALPESVRPVEEIGTLGNPTPQLVTRAMDGQAGPIAQEDTGYQAMFQRHAAPRTPETKPPEKELDR